MAEIMDGEALAASIRDDLDGVVDRLAAAGHRPTLATVLMGDDPASETYIEMKQRDCERLGIESRHVDVDGDAPPDRLYDVVAELNDDDAVDGCLVQNPLPEGVDYDAVIRRVDPLKDVDGFHPENVGRLVRGSPRFRPCTPYGIQRLLAAHDVALDGARVVVVGRSNIVGKPLANLLARTAPDGNATVTLCHSHTEDLAAETRRADVVVAAAGAPRLIDGSMLAEGAVVVDVGINRVETESGESELVGDVDAESARERASLLTPVPGGVGPMTRAMLMFNTVRAAARDAPVDVTLP